MRGLLVLLLVLLLPQAAAAQQIAVRSGEHENFSRLVFMFPAGTRWSTERVPGGYKLTTTAQAGRFDLSRVFDLIPKTRILGVSSDIDTRSVFIETAPTVHLESFSLPIGAAVLDIVDGAPPDEPSVIAPPGPSHRPAPNLGYLDLYWARRPDPAPSATASPEPERATAPLAAKATPLDIPDPRIESAEAELVDQLGRAASQGLIKMELPKTPKAMPAQAREVAAEPQQDPPQENGLALQSETVVDRDMASAFAGHRLANSGHSCPDDSDFDLSAWLGEKSPSEEMANARRDLVGEFDRPRPEAVLHMARVYIAHGFGAESKAVLKTFGAEAEQAAILSVLADIVDGTPVASAEPLAAMSGCDGKVAMWSVLAQDPVPSKAEVNFGALVRAYSALPPNIRNLVGPELSKRLIEMGAPDVARTVRSMLARVPEGHQTALDVMDAQIKLQNGEAKGATELLDKVAQDASPIAAESLALSIETKLSQGESIPASDVENAGALAIELKRTETGAKLERAKILGLASTAQFDAAFEGLSNWHSPSFGALKQKTTNDLMALLARVPDDKIFITTWFRNGGDTDPALLEPQVQIALADRLAGSGFWKSAKDVLTAETRRSDAGRMALAKAALAGHDASAAYSYLIGLTDENASALRGQALSLLGRHDSAEEEFARAGQSEAQVDEAWRSGNLEVVAQQGTEDQKRFVELFGADGTAAEAVPEGPPLGPLGRAQQLISLSQAERDAFAKMMEDLKSP